MNNLIGLLLQTIFLGMAIGIVAYEKTLNEYVIHSMVCVLIGASIGIINLLNGIFKVLNTLVDLFLALEEE